MNARKFIAVNSREALKLVRVELGEDAVILSNRKVADGVEIVAMGSAELSRLSETKVSAPKAAPAALNKQALNQAAALGAKVLDANTQREIATAKKEEVAATPAAEQAGILSEIKTMHNMLKEQMACMAWSDMQQRDPKRSTLMRDMINVGFSPALSRQLLDKMPVNGDSAWVRRILAHNIRTASAADDVVTRGGVYALVGPTGVGKTTTTAKLAARAVVRYGADKVALITTDSYRIGAHEQLKIYGKILGATVHAVRDTEDLKLTLSGLKHKHLVLIDTMGVGQRDSRVAGQAEMFDAAGVRRLLLLNATSAGGTLDDVVRMYHGSGVVGCIPTKLDEAVTLGTVLDVVVRHKLTMHYIASGQRVPEDLHEVNLDYLLHRAFKAGAKPTAFAMQELEFPAFMAGSGAAPMMRAEYAA
ncbi:MAG: flagellar biosynthesis protein FlhF [Gallionellaceae bacterium]|nr:MAG: flagellar biosynthesis protein FlhF [Gallionellaceae bacterium]